MLALICSKASSLHLQNQDYFDIVLLCGLCFLAVSVAAALTGASILRVFAEPLEISSSKMLAVLTESTADPKEFEKGLTQLTDEMVTQLETARQRERLIADFSSEVICCLSKDRKFLELNLQAEPVLGHSLLSLLANPVDAIVLEENRAALVSYFDQCKQEGSNLIFECQTRTGSGALVDIEWQCEWSQTLQCYFCLAKDISARKENERLKAEISAMVTHDLRAPVAGLSFLLDNLSSGVFGSVSERAIEEIAQAQGSVEKMLQLINQLLDAEKLEGGHMEADIKIVPLSALYEHADSLMSGIAASKDQKVKFPESDQLAFFDFDKTGQILCNLLSNAIKWSASGATIEVEEKLLGRVISISVRDQGPGIAENRKQIIFERFKSMSKPGPKEIASSGLGLYIAKKLTELQGGRIGVTSTLGQGSSFWFTVKQARETDLPGYDKDSAS